MTSKSKVKVSVRQIFYAICLMTFLGISATVIVLNRELAESTRIIGDLLIRRSEHRPKNTDPSSSDWLYGQANLPQDDPRFKKYIRSYHLTPPCKKPYSLRNDTDEPSLYGTEISRFFRRKKNGFFVEAGAHDGEFLSNTLNLERRNGWTGLLIEPDPFMAVRLRQKHRKAWSSDVCLSTKPYPQKVRFYYSRSGPSNFGQGTGIILEDGVNDLVENNDTLVANISKIKTNSSQSELIFTGYAECFPLYSIMAALEVTTIDYLSLDIQGSELKVLQAIPFEKLIIKFLSVQFNLIPEGEEALFSFLKSHHYQIILKEEIVIFAIHTDFKNEVDWGSASVPFKHYSPRPKHRRRKRMHIDKGLKDSL